ncbi:alpha/beta hydrolase [uncultured Paludibaculum sp.]|uniref:alpha/beta hydrolase n=1 Tax=uncultured Paludibaculum sp. TaxID=1765020 RepID=UPI002AABF04A|nr:alpha/beta hydrolase [uncultured Paludibaculum sp.]
MLPKIREILRGIWIVAGLSITAWMYAGFQTVDVGPDVLRGSDRVEVVVSDSGLGFRGRLEAKRVGLIFLPGGLVDPLAYAPLMRGIAEAGYEARLVYFPLRCACTESQIAQVFRSVRATIESEPETAWVLGGHSRGGMLTARYAHEVGTNGLSGLVLVGTTHPRDFSLAGLTLPITKVYASNDGVAPYAKMRHNAELLPAATRWVGIEGGNHVQFGYYRHQFGDDRATISRAEQQAALKAALVSLLAGVRR